MIQSTSMLVRSQTITELWQFSSCAPLKVCASVLPTPPYNHSNSVFSSHLRNDCAHDSQSARLLLRPSVWLVTQDHDAPMIDDP